MAATTVGPDVDDRIRPSGLRRIGELVERLPEEFEVGASNAHQNSITTTVKFPSDGIFGQIEQMNAVLQASTVVPTLYRNLVAARALLAELLEEYGTIEWDPDLTERVGAFLGEETLG